MPLLANLKFSTFADTKLPVSQFPRTPLLGSARTCEAPIQVERGSMVKLKKWQNHVIIE
jgi:hypothetical protein